MLTARDTLTSGALCCVALLGLVGCGGPYDASVEGMVTLDGSPIASGIISFVPQQGGVPAYARSDDSGHYEVYTGSRAGIHPGQYGVTIVARGQAKETHAATGGPGAAGARLTPAWYGSSKYTPLKADVEPGSNEINLELSSDPPPDWEPPGKKKRRRR